MYTKIIAVISLLLATSSFAAPTPPKDVYGEDKTAVMVPSDHPQVVIQLKSNPTTGYSWFLREYDGNLITPVKHAFEPNSNRKLMGAPGYETWTFHVKPAGFKVPQQTTLRFVYTRPWEDSNQAKQVTYRISTVPVQTSDKNN